MPAAEALACGCQVIGYDGQAGREYFAATAAIAVEDSDVLEFAFAVERFLAGYPSASAARHVEAQADSETILRMYCQKNQAADLVALFDYVRGLRRPARSGTLHAAQLRREAPMRSKMRDVAIRLGRRFMN